MAVFNIKSLAFKWYFIGRSGLLVYLEFSHLFMKQLGLSSLQIGMTNLCGVQDLLCPLLLFLGDRYRARSLMIWIATSLLVVLCLLPLLAIVVSLPTCFGENLALNNSGRLTSV